MEPAATAKGGNKIDIFLKNPWAKVGVGLSVVGMPIGYIVNKHVGWMDNPSSKARMLIHQLTFWTSAAIGIVLMHCAVFFDHLPFAGQVKIGGMKRLALGLLGGTLGAGGFPLGRWLSHKLYPEPHHGKEDEGKPLNVLSPAPFSPISTSLPRPFVIPAKAAQVPFSPWPTL